MHCFYPRSRRSPCYVLRKISTKSTRKEPAKPALTSIFSSSPSLGCFYLDLSLSLSHWSVFSHVTSLSHSCRVVILLDNAVLIQRPLGSVTDALFLFPLPSYSKLDRETAKTRSHLDIFLPPPHWGAYISVFLLLSLTGASAITSRLYLTHAASLSCSMMLC